MMTCNYTLNISKSLVKLFVLILPLVVVLSGCTEEKSYYYYTKNPTELTADYKYCETNPGRTVCDNIVKKYVKYTHEVEKITVIEKALDKAIENKTKNSNGNKEKKENYRLSVFNNLDLDLDDMA